MVKRTYPDGRFAWICNLDSFKENFFEKKIITPKDEQKILPLPAAHEMTFWDEVLPVMTLNYTKEGFNLTHGMGMFIPHKDYIDYIGMAFQGNTVDRPFSFYASILPQIHQLERDLYQEKRLWDACDAKGPLFSPPPVSTEPLCDALAMIQDKSTLTVHHPFKTIKISLEESLCIFLIKKGKNIAEISTLLHLPIKAVQRMMHTLANRLERPLYTLFMSSSPSFLSKEEEALEKMT